MRLLQLTRIAVLLLASPLAGADELTEWADASFAAVMRENYSPRTGLVYAGDPADAVRACGVDGVVMEDCAITGGIALSGLVDRWQTTRDETLKPVMRNLADGLLNLERNHGVPGFVARGLCSDDAKSIRVSTSRDQITHAVHGLWRYARSGICPADQQAAIAGFMRRVAERMARNCTPENGWDFLCADGSRDAAHQKMWQVNPHEAARLPMVYLAAASLTGEARWRQLYERFIDEALSETLRLTDSDAAARYDPLMPGYTFLQVQTSLELLLAEDEDPVRRARVRTAMQTVAAHAAERASKLKGGDERYLCASAEYALAQLMYVDAQFDAEQLEWLRRACRSRENRSLTGNRRVELAAAVWKWAARAQRKIKIEIADDTGVMTVTDCRNGRLWHTIADRNIRVMDVVRDESNDTVTVQCENSATGRRWRTVCRTEGAELLMMLDGMEAMPQPIAYPQPFATRRGERLVLPVNEGISFPVEERDAAVPSRSSAYSGYGLSMPFYGVTDDATGAGWVAIIETPDDATVTARQVGSEALWTPGILWEAQKGRLGYPRRIRFVFFERGGHVAMAKRYRLYAQRHGLWKPFSEKVKERPSVARLFGAVNIWCSDKGNVVPLVRELRAAGIDRILWSAGGSQESVQELAADTNLLVSAYDIYQDVYHPQQLAALGTTNGWNTEAWPQDVARDCTNGWLRAWGVKTKDGQWTHCATMCDRQAIPHMRRRVAADLRARPFNTRFIDAVTSTGWRECFDAAHPVTRTESRFWRCELLRILGDEFGLVVGSEQGHDAAVRFCDYFEGMMSLVHYRVPDSGRAMYRIWEEVPLRVARYQVGEKYRLPLWELVYHDAVCAHWYWGDYSNKLPALWEKRDLFNALYGTAGMFLFDSRFWRENRDRFVRSYRTWSPIARATACSEMIDHQILTPDRTVQRTIFADGTMVTVDFTNLTRDVRKQK